MGDYAESVSKHGQPWTRGDEQDLKSWWSQGCSWEFLASRLGRTEYACYCKLKALGKEPDDPREAFYDQPCKEIKLPKQKEPIMKNRTVATKTFVGETDASNLDLDQMLEVIEQEQAFIDRLSKLPKSDAVAKLLDKHNSNLKALNDLLGNLV